MKREAKAILFAVLLGLVAIAVLLCRPLFRGAKGQQTRLFPAASGAESTGGQSLLFETFSPEGRRRWRLELGGVTVAADRTLEGRGVSAEYFGTAPPTTMAAERIAYQPGGARLVFRGGIRLNGPALTLRAPELVWDERTGSFSISGGYVLTQGSTVLQGEKLWADEGFREIRALGAVKLRTTSIGGGAE